MLHGKAIPKLDTFERYERVLPNQSGRLCNRQGHPRLTSFYVVVSTCCSKTQLLSWNSQIKILGTHKKVWTTSSKIDQGSNRKQRSKWGHSLAERDSNGDEEQLSSFEECNGDVEMLTGYKKITGHLITLFLRIPFDRISSVHVIVIL